LKVRGHIDSPVAIWPRELDFGDADPGLSGEKFFEVNYRDRGSGSAPFRIEKITAGEGIQVKMIESKDPLPQIGGSIRFSVRVMVPRQAGVRKVPIMVKTSLHNESVSVLSKFRSRGVIQADPPSLLFDSRNAVAKEPALIRIRVVGDPGERTLTAKVMPDTMQPAYEIQRSNVETGTNKTTFQVRRLGSPDSTELATLRLSSGNDVLDVPIASLGK
jgi:hypothetical protein